MNYVWLYIDSLPFTFFPFYLSLFVDHNILLTVTNLKRERQKQKNHPRGYMAKNGRKREIRGGDFKSEN